MSERVLVVLVRCCAPAIIAILATAVTPRLAGAQEGTAGDQNQDLRVSPAQPDYTLVAIPTTMRVPLHRGAFRVTHRFARPVNRGSVGDLLRDAFGLDGGAFIGLEYRFGLLPGLQVGVHRTSLDKTIELFGQYGVLRQSRAVPVDISLWGSIDGTNNFRNEYSPGVGAIISRLLGQRAGFYVEPVWIDNTGAGIGVASARRSTFMTALGGRVRVLSTVYVAGEWAPRLAGHAPGDHYGSVAIEKRAGGHVFQLNFSNAVGTTMAQVAGGGLPTDWYLGFNISRKFN
jgi:hypothetical protein